MTKCNGCAMPCAPHAMFYLQDQRKVLGILNVLQVNPHRDESERGSEEGVAELAMHPTLPHCKCKPIAKSGNSCSI